MKNKTTIITIVLVIVVAVAGFFAGMQYQKSKVSQFAGAGGASGRRFAGAGFGGRGAGVLPSGASGARPITGQIISQDSSSITVKSSDGSSKIVLLSGNTAVTESTASSTQALKTGQQVLVIGTTDSTGSVTAQNIQINPQQMRMFNQGGGRNGTAPAQ